MQQLADRADEQWSFQVYTFEAVHHCVRVLPLQDLDTGTLVMRGQPTEGALLAAAAKLGLGMGRSAGGGVSGRLQPLGFSSPAGTQKMCLCRLSYLLDPTPS